MTYTREEAALLDGCSELHELVIEDISMQLHMYMQTFACEMTLHVTCCVKLRVFVLPKNLKK